MGDCQNYDPFWGTLNIRCRIIIGIQKGTIILTSTHMDMSGGPLTQVVGIIRVLLDSYSATITGWGVLLMDL